MTFFQLVTAAFVAQTMAIVVGYVFLAWRGDVPPLRNVLRDSLHVHLHRHTYDEELQRASAFATRSTPNEAPHIAESPIFTVGETPTKAELLSWIAQPVASHSSASTELATRSLRNLMSSTSVTTPLYFQYASLAASLVANFRSVVASTEIPARVSEAFAFATSNRSATDIFASFKNDPLWIDSHYRQQLVSPQEDRPNESPIDMAHERDAHEILWLGNVVTASWPREVRESQKNVTGLG